MPNEKTANLNLPLPHSENTLDVDVERLRTSLNMLDSLMGNLSGDLREDLASLRQALAQDLGALRLILDHDLAALQTRLAEVAAAAETPAGAQAKASAAQSKAVEEAKIQAAAAIAKAIAGIPMMDEKTAGLGKLQPLQSLEGNGLLTASWLLANRNLFGGLNNREVITESGSWTAPRTTIFFVFLVSGGGSGGGSSLSTKGGGGGGSGAYAMLVSFLEKDQSLSLSIGAGGVPILQGTGSSGGRTSLTVGGRTYAAPGGSGGGVSGGPVVGLGGASGVFTNLTTTGFLFPGPPGVSGSNGGGTAGPGGAGFDVYGDGSMMFGAGGKGGYGASSKGSPGTQGCVVIMY